MTTFQRSFARYIVLVLVLTTAFLGSCATSTTYVPWKNYPHLWSTPVQRPFIVLMCKCSDVSAEPSTVMDQARLFLTSEGAGLGNMLDYYSDVSYDAIALAGTRIAGWYNAPFTQAQLPGPGNRAERVKECANAVPPADVDFSRYFGVIDVSNVTNAPTQGGACYNGQKSMSIHDQDYNLACVVFDPFSLYTQFAAHEIGHALGMPHSYDNTQNTCGGPQPGEYCDPWDIMGGGTGSYCGGLNCAFVGANFPNPYGSSKPSDGPGVNAPNLLQMGWIPPARIGTYYIGGAAATFPLKALSHPIGLEPLTVEIVSSDPNDIYTVEYRQQDGWDAGIPENTVLIHEYKRGAVPWSYLQTNTSPISGEWLPGMGWTDPSHQVQVCVYGIDPSAATATVTIGPPSPSLFGCSSAPRVQIVAPASGSHLTAGVPFQLVATAMSGSGMPLPDAAVTWQANGYTLGTGQTLTTSLSSPGTDTITVTGTDPGTGLSATDSVTLYVDPPASPPATPTVQILAPTNGATYPVNGLSGTFALALSSQASAGVTTYLWSDSLKLFTDTHANDTLTLTPTISQISCNTPFSDAITLAVTDGHGQTASASVTITIERVCLR